jgi:hypothetical protein
MYTFIQGTRKLAPAKPIAVVKTLTFSLQLLEEDLLDKE